MLSRDRPFGGHFRLAPLPSQTSNQGGYIDDTLAPEPDYAVRLSLQRMFSYAF